VVLRLGDQAMADGVTVVLGDGAGENDPRQGGPEWGGPGGDGPEGRAPEGRGQGGRGRGEGGPGPGGSGPGGSERGVRRHGGSPHGGASGKRPASLRTGLIVVAAAVAVVVAVIVATASSGHVASRASAGAVGRVASGPLRVLSVTPSPGSAGVVGYSTVQIAFSVPLAAGSPRPVISPRVPGIWQVAGSTLTFTPDLPLAPATRFAVRIPAGRAGMRSASGGVLARPTTTNFRTAPYSQLRLAELLSQLGYLPLAWQPAADGRMTGGLTAGGGLVGQEELAYSPPVGWFTWQPGYPAGLRDQWRPDQANPLVLGAVMAFKSQHSMAVNGTTSQRFWHALFAAADAERVNLAGYTYAIASKGSPETLTIWHDGHVVLRSLANTGIPVAPTASGTYPVYLRFRFQIMSGTNPDGSHYADPVSFVSYFDGGEAVHYFPRGSYGFPQSLGCVELPYNSAERAWPYLTYGSLVTVTG